MPAKTNPFLQAQNFWDVKRLYADLATIKTKPLTPMEKLHLCGLLCGHSPAEIAEKLNKSLNGVESDLCNTIYYYVKTLVGRENQKVNNWRSILEWLEQAGYKIQIFSFAQSGKDKEVDLSVKTLNGMFKITYNTPHTQNIHFKVHFWGEGTVSREALKKIIFDSQEEGEEGEN